MTRLDGKVAVVTGGSSAIGRAVALRLAAAGATLIVADLAQTPREGGDPTHEVIRESAGQAEFVQVDVTDSGALDRMIALAQQHGGPDILVNNAGLLRAAPLEEMTEADYDAVMNVNVKGAYFASQAGARAMLAHGRGGAIVNLSSIGGLRGVAGITAYCAAKGAVRALTYAMAKELGSRGIRVCALHPGVIDTAMTRIDVPVGRSQDGRPRDRDVVLGRFGRPEDIAAAVLFLASDEAAFVTGTSLTVDGGQLCIG